MSAWTVPSYPEKWTGVSLADMIDRQVPLGPEAALTVLKSALLSLDAGHALRIAYRDYKPGNVLIDADGRIKLTDLGVAVAADDPATAAGSPCYRSPEQWLGAPSRPATDRYAATAVFFECLTGRTPFRGNLAQQREQHLSAGVRLDGIDPPLQGLIARGMAKDPARRPPSAVEFLADLEQAARAACGPYWEETGRAELAGRATALLASAAGPGFSPAPRPRQPSSGLGGRGRRVLAIAAVAAAAVVVIGGVAAAVTLGGKGHSHGSAVPGAASQVMAVTPSFKAVADVTPPVAASKCTAPTSFAYSGTLSATAPGTVRYQWIYSSGKPGPVQTVDFTSAGHKVVVGATVQAERAGGGWSEIKLISPVAQTSNEATYKLLCGGSSAGGFTVTAAVTPSARTADCAAAAPAFTAAGSVKAAKAGAVTYYWARSDGVNSAPATLTFTGPGTAAAKPLTIIPAAASGSGSAVLVVTSPVTTASAPAAYTLTCTTPKTQAVNGQSPAPGTGNPSTSDGSPAPPSQAASSQGPSPTSPASPRQTLQLIVNAQPVATVAFPYSGTFTASGGTAPFTWNVTGLPAGLTASPNGATLTIGGTPAATAQGAEVTVTVRDSTSATATASLSLIMSHLPIAILAMPGTTVPATFGVPYSFTGKASGGDGTYNWLVTGLPSGVTATPDGANLLFSGTPTEPGSFSITVRVSDAGGASMSESGWFVVLTPDWVISPSTLPTGTVGTPYTATLSASGGDGHPAWETPDGLPPGLTLDTATGTITGTPTAAGTFSVVETVTGGTATTATLTLVIHG